jgi:hypothetical protein
VFGAWHRLGTVSLVVWRDRACRRNAVYDLASVDPTNDQFTDALERFRAAHPGTEIDDDRFAIIVHSIWNDAIDNSPPEVAAELLEFVTLGAHLRLDPADDDRYVHVRLGTDKSSIPIGGFWLDAVTAPPHG